MAVPKRKTSKARGRKRRSHQRAKSMQISHCSQCGNAVPTHVVCPTCGYYQGRTLVEIEEE